MPITFKALWSRPIKVNPEYVESGVLGESQVLILAAPVDSFKSVTALNFAHCLANGEKLFGHFVIPKAVKVLYLDGEIGLHYFQERLKLFYEKPDDISDNLVLASKEDEATQFSLDNQMSFGKLRKAINDVKPNVIVLDCLNPFLSDEENEQTFSRAAANVHSLQIEFKEQGLSFVIIHHMREVPVGGDALSWYHIRGHGKLVDWPATRITMKKAKKGKLMELTMRFLTRHGPEQADLIFNVDEKLRVTKATGMSGLGGRMRK